MKGLKSAHFRLNCVWVNNSCCIGPSTNRQQTQLPWLYKRKEYKRQNFYIPHEVKREMTKGFSSETNWKQFLVLDLVHESWAKIIFSDWNKISDLILLCAIYLYTFHTELLLKSQNAEYFKLTWNMRVCWSGTGKKLIRENNMASS